MTVRKLLSDQLTDAWENTIRKSYDKRLINTEHGLHAHFYSYLRDQFSEDSVEDQRHVYFEQSFVVGERTLRPDLVICNGRQIIGVVELKYAPRSLLKLVSDGVSKDIETLRAFLGKEEVNLVVERYLGPEPEVKKYSLGKDALLCWAGVYKAPHSPFDEVDRRDFVDLHAVTSDKDKAKIYKCCRLVNS